MTINSDSFVVIAPSLRVTIFTESFYVMRNYDAFLFQMFNNVWLFRNSFVNVASCVSNSKSVKYCCCAEYCVGIWREVLLLFGIYGAFFWVVSGFWLAYQTTLLWLCRGPFHCALNNNEHDESDNIIRWQRKSMSTVATRAKLYSATLLLFLAGAVAQNYYLTGVFFVFCQLLFYFIFSWFSDNPRFLCLPIRRCWWPKRRWLRRDQWAWQQRRFCKRNPRLAGKTNVNFYLSLFDLSLLARSYTGSPTSVTNAAGFYRWCAVCNNCCWSLMRCLAGSPRLFTPTRTRTGKPKFWACRCR